MISLKKNGLWILRCARSGEPFASQALPPPDPDMVVVWNFTECYWCWEPIQ